MNEPSVFPLALALTAASTVFIGQDAMAQTCASPQHAFANSTVSGSTCGANALPELNHGTVSAPGDDLVFTVSGEYGVSGVTLSSDTTTLPNLFVFVCSGCGVNAECVDGAEVDPDTHDATVNYPQDGREYYVIVDGDYPGCKDFSLTPLGPLRQDP